MKWLALALLLSGCGSIPQQSEGSDNGENGNTTILLWCWIAICTSPDWEHEEQGGMESEVVNIYKPRKKTDETGEENE